MDDEHTKDDVHALDTVLETLAQERSARQEAASACLSRTQLEALRAHTLSPDEETRVVQHLAACGVCRDHLVTLDVEVPPLSSAVQRRVLQAFRPRRAGWAWWSAGATVVAAAVALLVVRPVGPSGGSLPHYVVALGGSVKETRGSTAVADALPVYYPESELVVMARPVQGEASTPPHAAVYLEASDGTFRRLSVPPAVTVEPGGLVIVKVRAGEVLGHRFGRHRLRLLLTLQETNLPDRLGDGWQEHGSRVIEKEFEYRSPERE